MVKNEKTLSFTKLLVITSAVRYAHGVRRSVINDVFPYTFSIPVSLLISDVYTGTSNKYFIYFVSLGQ